jgi:phosphomannomutase
MAELKISASWVRGVVGDGLTPELAVNFACAFGTWLEGGPVAVGRDARFSSPMLHAAVAAGLMSTGCEIVDLGICSTPLVSFAVREFGCAGGISITGSHNDSHWNALKFLGPDGVLLNAIKGEEFLDIYHASAFRAVAPGPAARLRACEAPAARYLDHLLAGLDVESMRRRGFRVAADFCNGTCAEIMGRFLTALGATLSPLNPDPRGSFAHSPAPTPANMGALARLTVEEQADLGAAVNIDGDRVAFVTADGTALSEEHTLPLAALGRLARRPGPVVTNFSSSRMIEALALPLGLAVVRAPVGESHVMERGLEENAVLAGEGSGGVTPLPGGMTFDALPTLAIVLETMVAEDTTLADLSARLPRFEMRKGALPCRPDQAYRALDCLRSRWEGLAPDCTDGIRLEWNDAWTHVRVSSTEPLVRVIVEAESRERAESLFRETVSVTQEAILRSNSPSSARGVHDHS